jgi:hypothetical protein
MKTQIKLFYNDIRKTIEQEVNDWLTENRSEKIIDIKYAGTESTFEVMVIFETMTPAAKREKNKTVFTVPNENAQKFEELLNDAEYYHYNSKEGEFSTTFTIENISANQELEIIGLINEAKL